MIWRVFIWEKNTASLDEIRERWSLLDVLAANELIDNIEYAEHRNRKRLNAQG